MPKNYCCAVLGCGKKPSKHGVRLFPFPASMRIRQEWMKVTGRESNWTPTSTVYICEVHFIDGAPTADHPYPNIKPSSSHSKSVQLGDPISKSQPNSALFGHSFSTSSCSQPNSAADTDEVQLIYETRTDEVSRSPSNQPNGVAFNLEISSPSVALPTRKRKATMEGVETEIFAITSHDHCYRARTTARMDSEDSYSDLSSDEEEIIGKQARRHHWETSSPSSPLERKCMKALRRKSFLRTSDEKLRELAKRVMSRIKKIKVSKPRFRWDMLEGDNARVRFYTGFPTWRVLRGFLQTVVKPLSKDLVIVEKRSAARRTAYKRKLSIENECCLVLMKLKLNWPNQALADHFGISKSYCGRLLRIWIPHLAAIMAPMVAWVPRDERSPPPSTFHRFPNCSAVIDCFEIFIEKPRNRKDRRRAWSQYKGHETVKILVAIAPNGTIMYFSAPWGGRTKDEEIVQKDRRLLDHLKGEPSGSLVLADKGFRYAAITFFLNGTALDMPPVLKKNAQLPPAQIEGCRAKSNVRIHVERCIGQLRRFRIIRHVFVLSKLYHLNDALTICAAVTNLWTPITY